MQKTRSIGRFGHKSVLICYFLVMPRVRPSFHRPIGLLSLYNRKRALSLVELFMEQRLRAGNTTRLSYVASDRKPCTRPVFYSYELVDWLIYPTYCQLNLVCCLLGLYLFW